MAEADGLEGVGEGDEGRHLAVDEADLVAYVGGRKLVTNCWLIKLFSNTIPFTALIDTTIMSSLPWTFNWAFLRM